jgi:hypothetical protein
MKFSRIITLAFIAFVSFALFGACDKGIKKIEPTPAPAAAAVADDGHNHPPGTNPHAKEPAAASPHGDKPMVKKQAARKVIEPDFLKGAWAGVKVKLTDKTSNEAKVLTVPLKKKYQIEGTDLSIVVEYFFPSFMMNPTEITSVSNEVKNPAMKVSVFQGETKLGDNWSFAKMPQVHGFEHDKWGIALVEGVPTKK